MWTQIEEDTFKLHLEECGLANDDLVQNGFLGGSDCLSQGLAAGTVHGLTEELGCGLGKGLRKPRLCVWLLEGEQSLVRMAGTR